MIHAEREDSIIHRKDVLRKLGLSGKCYFGRPVWFQGLIKEVFLKINKGIFGFKFVWGPAIFQMVFFQ